MNLKSLQRDVSRLKKVIGSKRGHQEINPEITKALEDVNTFCELFSNEKQAKYHIELQSVCDNHKRVIIEAPPRTGKSQQITLRRTLWRIGHNPNIRIGIICATAETAHKWVRAIQSGIESDVFKKCFPNVQPGYPWNADKFYVKRNIQTHVDPTVMGIGVDGTFLGARLDLIILDDILTVQNTSTKTQRTKVLEWIDSSMINGRLVPGGQLIIIGNTWTRDDAMHELSNRLDNKGNAIFYTHRQPACDLERTISYIPELWSIDELTNKFNELGTNTFIWQYLCQPRGDEDSRFKIEWFDRRSKYQICDSFKLTNMGQKIVCGIDIGLGLEKQHDKSAFVILLQDIDGTINVLNTYSGRWEGPKLIDMMVDLENRFPGIVFRVETVAAQRHLVQFARGKVRSPIACHNTIASNKSINGKAWAIEKIALYAEQGKLLICRNQQDRLTQEMMSLRDGLIHYQPRDHTADEVMGLCFGIAQLHVPERVIDVF